jgi:hypothetical protein
MSSDEETMCDMTEEMTPTDPAPSARWQLWYEDRFDRETPRRIEQSGVGLLAGLMALWRHHLRDTVKQNGQLGFSRFNLWWQDERRSLAIEGDREGQRRLRDWTYGDGDTATPPGTAALLAAVALTQAHLHLAGQTAAPILEAAAASATPEALLARLAALRAS